MANEIAAWYCMAARPLTLVGALREDKLKVLLQGREQGGEQALGLLRRAKIDELGSWGVDQRSLLFLRLRKVQVRSVLAARSPRMKSLRLAPDAPAAPVPRSIMLRCGQPP